MAFVDSIFTEIQLDAKSNETNDITLGVLKCSALANICTFCSVCLKPSVPVLMV